MNPQDESMEGLIPFLLHSIKSHQRQRGHGSIRSLSDDFGRSYHRLLSTQAWIDGSSHRRPRSEFIGQRPGMELLRSDISGSSGNHAAPPHQIFMKVNQFSGAGK